MQLETQTPKKALKAFLKQKPLRSEIEVFKKNLIVLLDKISVIEKQPKDESEEHLKNNIRDFLRDTYYRDTNAINTKDKKDLVIHLGKNTDSDAAVIIEAKRPANYNEMVSHKSANKKALHELILYYLNERNEAGNNQLKNLVITNINEWYIIDANYFDKHIYRNAAIKKLYDTKISDKKDNPWFYEEIRKIVENSDLVVPSVYFDIRQYETALRNEKKDDDKSLIALYKILSPQHLLKISAANDSNSLNENFYKELLHIVGLEEAKEGSKNVIRRKLKDKNPASLMEATIQAIITEDVLHRIPDQTVYGKTKEEQIFSIALELCITWVNRILFLKLLEGQLITYHAGNKDYRFLNSENIHDFDELFKVFHRVLAVSPQERAGNVKDKYSLVPYLNSSLFEISDLEDKTIKINALDNSEKLFFITSTVLKEERKRRDSLPALEYLFKFLDAYDFSSEGGEDIQEDKKTIINASVLGKVFEKINGYRDGSIFTPAFITMYMCRQSIRLSVIDKFNSLKGWKEKDIDGIYSKIDDRHEANKIIDSLKICDPAVGSGHFLVSALNEIIAIKSELGVLMDETGKTLRDYEIEIINDELIITNENGDIFSYNPKSKESSRVQRALFKEKQNIIESCLFGVDINPNSVKICRLRLWIELLKNSYYKDGFSGEELETLPNIDINIKCGNSLLSRFGLDSDLSKPLKNIKYDVKEYRNFVSQYKNEKSRDAKREVQKIINSIKDNLQVEIFNGDSRVIKLKRLQNELFALQNQGDLFGLSKKQTDAKKKKLELDIDAVSKEIQDVRNNKIYRNAFEWRFEFPEVLGDNGEFEGFDLVVGNPPYIKEDANRDAFNGLRNNFCYQGKMDIWYLFGELGLSILKPMGLLNFIATNNWVTNAGASNFRNAVINNSRIIDIADFGSYMIFENASIQTMIMLLQNDKSKNGYAFNYRKLEGKKVSQEDVLNLLSGFKSEACLFLNPLVVKEALFNKTLTFNSDDNDTILEKIKRKANFFLREKPDKSLGLKAEIGSGIDVLQDFVSKSNAEKLCGAASAGDGIFVLSDSEVERLRLGEADRRLIRPYFTTDQLQKYYGNPKNKYWIIYTQSDIGKVEKNTNIAPIDNCHKIREHLDKFKSVITSDFKPYGLHRSREQHLFQGEKIFALRKCSSDPRFTYTDFDCFVSRAFLVIQSDRINLKFLTGILNSKMVAFWLKKRGKMQGSAYQIDKDPLLEIPIFLPSESKINEIAKLVDEVIDKRRIGMNSDEIERKIDNLVYGIYEITPEEQVVIEG